MNPALAQVLERSDIRRGDGFAVAPAPTLASGFPRLDAELPGGGWPRGALTELLPEGEGIGELDLLLPALAALTAAGQTVVLVAPPHAAHAPAWAAAGIRLDRLRLVFPRRPRDALWAGVEALRCGGVAATLLWLDPLFRGQLPANSLRRLQVAAGEGGGGAFCFRPARLAAEASPAPLRERGSWPSRLKTCEEIVASGPQRGAAGAQLPECTWLCMRIASTAQAPIRPAK